jgi:GNAT superfamily N-acetyltransferase
MVVTVEEVTAGDTLGLRSRVLREGRPHLGFPDDDDDRTVHLGARVNGELVGVATFAARENGTWQLRGMAVDGRMQGQGIGRALLDAAVDRLRTRQAERVWANGRDTALGFYERSGWKVVGDGYEMGPGGLPHHRVELDLTG